MRLLYSCPEHCPSTVVLPSILIVHLSQLDQQCLGIAQDLKKYGEEPDHFEEKDIHKNRLLNDELEIVPSMKLSPVTHTNNLQTFLANHNPLRTALYE